MTMNAWQAPKTPTPSSTFKQKHTYTQIHRHSQTMFSLCEQESI